MVITDSDTEQRQTWRPLRLFNIYRLLLASALLTIAFSDIDLRPIGQYDPTLYITITSLYFLACIISTFTIACRSPSFHSQVHTLILVDILALTLIMHASGGVHSGLGMLMIATIAGGGMLLAGQVALQVAAIATLAMLGEHAYFHLTNPLAPAAYTHAGLLGAAFFATAILAHALAKRARASEALAHQRGIDLANMEQLAQYVIQRMQTGVIVIDKEAHIWLINDSARQLLNTATVKNKETLGQTCPQLADQYEQWKTNEDHDAKSFRATTAVAEVLPKFAVLGENVGTLVFLEDTATIAHHAQQLKLASMGRLAGSIAHEIRNPLGAISHAGQLLEESPNLDTTDVRLTEIIRTNAQRMNSIIENVLQLGRRKQSIQENIELQPWLENFVSEFCRNEQLELKNITLSVEPNNISVNFDANQLNQVFWNLCHNGIRHSLEHSGRARLIINVGQNSNSPSPYADIIDFGPGIPDNMIEQVFEPFFTTETKGTGLGLYIAKELTECNHAQLTYRNAETQGGCFRITFTDPRRRRSF